VDTPNQSLPMNSTTKSSLQPQNENTVDVASTASVMLRRGKYLRRKGDEEDISSLPVPRGENENAQSVLPLCPSGKKASGRLSYDLYKVNVEQPFYLRKIQIWKGHSSRTERNLLRVASFQIRDHQPGDPCTHLTKVTKTIQGGEGSRGKRHTTPYQNRYTDTQNKKKQLTYTCSQRKGDLEADTHQSTRIKTKKAGWDLNLS